MKQVEEFFLHKVALKSDVRKVAGSAVFQADFLRVDWGANEFKPNKPHKFSKGDGQIYIQLRAGLPGVIHIPVRNRRVPLFLERWDADAQRDMENESVAKYRSVPLSVELSEDKTVEGRLHLRLEKTECGYTFHPIEFLALEDATATVKMLASKAERSELSNVLAREPGVEVEDVYRPEMKVFDDEWRAARGTVIASGVTYGCHDVDDLTYGEAIEIKQLYSKRKGWDYSRMFFASTVRALLPIWVPNATPISLRNMFQSSRSISEIVFRSNVSPCVVTISELFSAFHTCKNLREIDAILDVSQASNVGAIANFQECKNLEEIRIRNLKTDINFSSSPKLSLASLQYIVDNASNTGPVTVTVHPDVYAKLTDEANAEWHVLTALASEKNITFATV